MSTTYQVVLIVGCSVSTFNGIVLTESSEENRYKVKQEMLLGQYDIDEYLPNDIDLYNDHVGICIDVNSEVITLDKDTMHRIEVARAIFRSKVGITGEPYFVLYSY